MPDMHIVVNGVSIEAELKAPAGVPSEMQIQKINQIDQSGCIGVILYPKDFDKFKRLICFIKKTAKIDPETVVFCGLERGWKK